MTRAKHGRAASEASGDRGSRRLLRAVDARRRLNTGLAAGFRSNARFIRFERPKLGLDTGRSGRDEIAARHDRAAPKRDELAARRDCTDV